MQAKLEPGLRSIVAMCSSTEDAIHGGSMPPLSSSIVPQCSTDITANMSRFALGGRVGKYRRRSTPVRHGQFGNKARNRTNGAFET